VSVCLCLLLPNYSLVNKDWYKITFTRAVLSNLFDTAGHLVNFPPAGGPQSRGGPWWARRARAYKGGLGAEPTVRSRGIAPGQGIRGGRSPLKLKHFFASECSMETANSPIFLKFGNAKDHQTLSNFASWFHLTNHQIKTTIYVGRWRATWNPLTGRMRPAGRGLDSTALEYPKVGHWKKLNVRNQLHSKNHYIICTDLVLLLLISWIYESKWQQHVTPTQLNKPFNS